MILVTGGTGKTGHRVVKKLQSQNQAVRTGSRKADPPFDWEDQSTWSAALEGIDKVYISFQPDLAMPGAVETVRQFTNKAVEKGVKHLVLLSGRGEKEAQECEEVVQNAGADWTIVRASWFNQNFSENYLLEPILAGHVALPVGPVKEPFVDAHDIAEVAATALTQKGHTGKVYEVTGPELLTFAEAIGHIARATGREIQYQEVSMEEYQQMLKEHQVPQPFIDLLTYLFTEVLDGHNASIAHGVQEALGRKPITFQEYAKGTAETGIWQPKNITEG